ncbi:MAG: hypothetical protein ACREFJ_10190 [Acetobacteraceae bacterium]
MGIATVKPTGIAPSKRNPLLTDSGDVRISGQLQIVIATDKKKVVVPWDKVEFGDAKLDSDNKVLMPDATRQSLNSMPAFHYTNPKGH